MKPYLILAVIVAFPAATGLTGRHTPKAPAVPDTTLKVMHAMTVLAATENTTPDKLMEDPSEVALVIVRQASEKRIDPLLLVTIAWTESRFRADAKGDIKNGVPRSCGMTQVRTDFKGRPTCKELLNPEVALGWTASHLVATSRNGRIRLAKYNGGNYEVRIWRKMDWLRRELMTRTV